MADIFKDSVTAGREARQRGQAIKRPGSEELDLGTSQMVDGYKANRGEDLPTTRAPSTRATSSERSIEDIVNEFYGSQPEPEAAPQPTPQAGNPDGNLAKDLGLGLAQGVVGLGGGVYELGNMVTRGALDKGTEAVFGRSGSSALKGATDYLRSKESTAMAQQRAELDKADGFVDSFVTVVTNPRLAGSMFMEMVPQLATVAGAAKTVATRTLSSAAVKNLAPEVAQKMAATNATRTVLGLNAAMEGSSAGSDVRQTIMAMSEAELDSSPQYQKLVQQYGDTEQGRADARMRLANDASLFATAIGASVSAISGKVTGAAALESKVLTKGVLGTEAPKRTALGVAKDIVKAGAKEIPQESFEEGGSQFGQNVGLAASGAKPDQDLMAGVSQAAGAGGAMGLLAGAGFGAAGNAKTAIQERREAKAAESKVELQDTAPPGATGADFGLTDQQFFSGVRSEQGQKVLAGLYAIGDEDTKQRIEALNDRLGLGIDFYGQSQNQDVINYGQQLAATNAPFIQALNKKMDQFMAVPTNASQRGEEVNTTPYMPVSERQKMDQELKSIPPDQSALEQSKYDANDRDEMTAETLIASLPPEVQDQARELIKKKSAPSGTLVPGPEAQETARGIPLDVLRLGYERRVRNLQNMPEEYRAQQAQAGIEEMVREGFTPEVAAEVFAPLGQQITAAPAPVDTDTNDETAESLLLRKALSRSDRDMYGEDTPDTQYVVEKVDPAIEGLAKVFGVQALGFRYIGSGTRQNQRKGIAAGTNDKKTRVIGVNVRNADQHLFVIGHEVLHILAKENPEEGAALVKLIKSYISEEGQAAYRERLTQSGYKPSAMDEEMVADAFGLMFKDKQFWSYVNNKQPTLIEKIINILDDLIKKFGNIAPARELAISKYLTDIEQVRQILSEFAVSKKVAPATPKKRVKFQEVSNETTTNQPEKTESQPVAVEKTEEKPPVEEPKVVEPEVKADEVQQDNAVPVQAVETRVPNTDVEAKRLKVLAGRADTMLESGKLTKESYGQIVQLIKDGKADEARAELQKANANKRKVLKKEEVAEIKDANKITDEDFKYKGAPVEPGPQQTPQSGKFDKNTQGDLTLPSVPSLEKQRQDARSEAFKNEKFSDTKASVYIRQKGVLDTGAYATHNVYDQSGNLIGRVFRSPRFAKSFPFVDKAGLEQSTRDWGRDDRGEPAAAGYAHNSLMAQFEKAGFRVEPIVAPNPQQELDVKQGLTAEQTKLVNSYRRKAAEIIGMTGDESTQEKALAEFRRFQEEMKKRQQDKAKRDAAKGIDKQVGAFDDDKGGVFSNFAKSGVYGAEGFAQAMDKDARSRAQKAAADEEARLIGAAMDSKVDRFLTNVQYLLGEMDKMRAEMEQAGIPPGSINSVLATNEAQLRALLDPNNPLTKTLANPVGSEEAEKADAQDGSIGDNADQVGPENLDLFTPEGVAIADKLVQDVVDKKLTPLEAVRAFNEERKANKTIGYMDVVAAFRARGIEPDPVLYSLGTQPAIQVSLSTYIQDNAAEMSFYVARQRWLESLDKILSETRISPAEKKSVENMLSADEKSYYGAWKRGRQKMVDRLAERVTQEGGEEVLFESVEDAFPDALPVLYRYSELDQLDRTELENMRAIMGQDLKRAWVEDALHVMIARPDLTDSLLSQMTEEEQKLIRDRRDLRLREEFQRAAAIGNSGAYNQLFQMQHIDPNVPGVSRLFAQFSTALQYANQLQKQQILTAALHINAVIGKAKKAGKTIDTSTAASNVRIAKGENAEKDIVTGENVVEVAVDGLMKDIYGVDTLFGKNADEIANILSRVKVDENEASQFVRNQDAETVSDEDVQVEEQGDNSQNPEWLMQQAQGLRLKKGAHSGNVVHAEIEAHMATFTSGWNAPHYMVLQNPLQIEDKQLQAAVLARGAAKGVFDPKTGTTYLFTDAMESVADAEFTFLHEVYGHFGMRAFLGTKLDAFLQNTYKTNLKIRNAADTLIEQSKNEGYEMSQVEAVEEVLADMAAKGEESSGFKNILGKLIQFLRSISMNMVANWMSSKTTAEVAYVLHRAQIAARTQGRGAFNGAPADVRFAMSKLPVELYATKDGKVVGYARLNPMSNTWNVFAGNDFKSGDFGTFNVDKYEHALAILNKVGKITKTKDYKGRPTDRQPGDFIDIPSFNDVAGWAKFQRYAQINLQNQYLPIFEVAQYLKDNGRENDVSAAILLYEGKLAPLIEETRKKYAEPINKLLDEIGKAGGSLVEVDDYLAARHAKERNRVIRSINSKNFSGSGISDAEADTLLAEFAAKPYASQLEKVGKLTDKMSKQKIAYMVQTGLISEEQAAGANEYDHYVNLSGNPDLGLDQYDKDSLGGKAFNLRGRDLKRATGRKTKAVDVLANTLNSYTSTLVRGQKNVVAESVLRMIEENPDPNFAAVQRINEIRTVDTQKLAQDQNIIKAIGDKPGDLQSGKRFLAAIKAEVEANKMTVEQAKEELIKRIQEAADMQILNPNTATAAIKAVTDAVVQTGRLNPDGYVTMKEDPAYIQNEQVMVVKRGGQIVTVEFKESSKQLGTFANAIHGMRGQSSPDTLEAFGKFNRFLSQLITSYNPAWVFVNGIRDVQTAMANMAADPKVGMKIAQDMRREWRKSWSTSFRYEIQDQMDTAKGARSWILKRMEKRTNPMDPADLALYQEFKSSGAQTFFLDRGGVEDQLKGLEKAMSGKDNTSKLESVGKLMEAMSLPMESATRFAAYKALRKNGWSVEEAALYAKDLTVNFNLKGASSLVRNLFIFFNPAIQGTVRLFKDYSRSKDGVGKYMPSNQFLKVAGSFAMMGMLVNLIASALTGDDDDTYPDKQNQIPSYKRSTSMVLIPDVPGFAIPLPYGWNAFYALGHFAMDSLFGNTPIEVTATRIINTGLDATLPIRIEGSFVRSLTPTPLAPFVELAINENKQGAPIYKEKDAYTDYERPNAYMHFDTVSPISRTATRWLNEQTGGKAYGTGGIIDINPAWVDYMIGSVLPGLFNEVYKGASLAVRAGRGEDIKRTPMPLIDRFSAYVPDGYAAGAFRRANTFIASKYKEAESVDGADREKILKQYPNLGAAQGVMNETEQAMKKMRQDLKAVDENKYLTDEYKVKARNEIKALEKIYYERAVRAAIQAGFEDKVLGEDAADSTLSKAARYVRKGSL